MAPVAATWSGRGSSSVFRGVLSGVLLVAAVILGLLGMHTLNLHGTAAADTPAAAISAAMTVSEPVSAHHGTAQVQAHPSGTTGMSCAGCGTDDHAGMAMMCVLALLLALVLLIAPGVLRGWTAMLLRSPLLEVLAARVLPRAPSLHVLCISRT
ncbi:DUF6153 family protein [Microbacterium sp. STF-2]|uniref:DUF6153 family protein n=1 Tax=Microbacterium sp. STF-2 TaxID=3031132 RepID=UPI002AFF04CD|nr:DUF6153 family protein [Microbacterium sp. STF-2]MEA1261601.1 DUF6153 family protein [Microbacterium sp. STF-2]